MPHENVKRLDWFFIGGAFLAFTLPLTLLMPNFSISAIVPKVQITRFHILAYTLTWYQLNAVVIALVTLLFLVHIEIRKRKLDDLVERVLQVSQATDKTVEVEAVKQVGTMRACAELLDAAAEQYEHLALLRQELYQRNRKEQPPTVDSVQAL